MVAEDQVVAQDFLAGGEQRVSGESHALAVDSDEQRHLVFGVARRMRNLELEFLPLELLSGPKTARHLERLAEDAAEIVAAGILEDVDHVLQAPDIGPVAPLQMPEPVHVV